MDPSQTPFGYDFTSNGDAVDTSNPPLLNQDDNNLLQGFWENPDADFMAHPVDGTGFTPNLTWSPPIFQRAEALSNAAQGASSSDPSAAFDTFATHRDGATAAAPDLHNLTAPHTFHHPNINSHLNDTSLYFPNSGPISPPVSNRGAPTDSGETLESFSHSHDLVSPRASMTNEYRGNSHFRPRHPSQHSIHQSPQSHQSVESPFDQRSPASSFPFGFTPTSEGLPVAANAHHGGRPVSFDGGIGYSISPTTYGRPMSSSIADSRAPRFPNYGSDANFNSNGFRHTGPDGVDSAIHERIVFNNSHMLERNQQTDQSPTTSEPTPAVQHRRRKSHHISNLEAESQNQSGIGEVEAESEDRTNKRRRRGNATNETSSGATRKKSQSRDAAKENAPATSKANGNRRRSSQRANSASMAGENSTQSAPTRTHKVNLSEAQKRENHIQSEQKRRNLIQVHFKTLNKLVPALWATSGGAMSKNQILQETADFLEGLHQGNEQLRQMLSDK